ncbi:MAG TPA: type II toxin-antitoxin system RelE/ParE family toxin [Anaerohalosphaeraceae bacterium]|jgi:toxin ParE1/3/4|nr:type II toxin-antitoxin system RelE/ParE family toxin [Anaerohalosphaeraceae bacterium]HRT49163.1 type II toxin-antitoxin system RelE/ParE family toxin [Anaerohalosphaeraceae bacterium]HRT87796.1 type II toxin-antitoxin system RelE/ParE family toxin [Anaerohalosphaeraceae bacterium]
MAFRIVWSETATEDLKEIVRYIAMDNPGAAAHLGERLLSRIDAASRLPFSNRAVPEKDDELIRECILSPYRILYQVDENKAAICILRVWHASRGIPETEQSGVARRLAK